ncbi:DUF2232 domain-containing protein [Williamsia muralis]|uniref:DUF2232 domain-containing protein n=1 Tax=Williamsia marianensis TaxID=85044 RepID=A0ABU4EPB9_WILMA|nr:DUF2232 domain-containing protein [Williamsia muralis]MDV7133099.1 DUF2232 domain-containing protein [Williamsia muralis]
MSARARRRVTAIEIAEAAALADVAAAICVLSRFLPIGGAASLVASVPFAILAGRRRLRVSLLGALTGYIVAFLFGGFSAANLVGSAAIFGTLSGIALRRGWNAPRVTLTALFAIAVPSAAVATGLLALFTDYREFMIKQIDNGWRGTKRLMDNAGFDQFTSVVDPAVNWCLDYWWIAIPASGIAGVTFSALTVFLLHRRPVPPMIARLGTPHTDERRPDAGPVGPLPVRLDNVAVTYPGATEPVIADVSMTLAAGELVAVTGPNGVGKSTLAKVVAGRDPTAGTVSRPGAVGLGRPGGTAVISQRPETQVLGMVVADDLAWGNPGLTETQMEALLDQVGLGGMLYRETGTLSGGQLQRLAIAAALSRHPAVLISDESTAMIDQEGRAAVNGIFRSLADHGETAVLQITHDTDESAVADREIALDSRHSSVSTKLRTTTGAGRAIRGAQVSLIDVGYAHDAGTPWHNQIFSGLNLHFEPGSAVLLTGPNGAGKSTLARVMTGLQQPTSGRVLVDGMPVQNGRQHALLGFQYSRLQIVRSCARADVKDAAGVDDTAANAALLELGLNSAVIGDTLVDELSVGQQRRVALAGLLACKPRLLVLDEPLAGLDAPARAAMVAALQRVKASGTTLVVISHDVGELDALVDRTIVVDEGTVDGQPVTPAPPPSSLKSTANLASVVRTLPHASPARRWWVGTKLVVLAAIALMFALEPTWLSVAVGATIAAGWTVLGRVPRAAVPRLPLWLVGITLFGGFITALGGDEPYVTVGGVEFGLGGAAYWGILICMTVISLYSALLFCWTTPMVEIPAFAQRLVGWAARLGIPAQSAAVSVALALRLCPFLISDFRTLLQTIAQRRSDKEQTARERINGWAACLPIVCSLACQNGRELAAAIEARGGVGSVSRSDRSPRFMDLLVLIVVLGSVGAVVALG